MKSGRTGSHTGGEALLYLPEENLLYLAPPGYVPEQSYYILTDPAFTRTLMRAPTGEQYIFIVNQ